MNTLGVIRSSGAPAKISGIEPNNIPLRTQIAIYEDGEPLDLTDLEFEFSFRACEGTDTGKLVCTTSGGLTTATVTIGSDSVEVLQFDDVDVTDLCGDYIADFILKDADGKYTQLAHGVVTFRNEPATPTI